MKFPVTLYQDEEGWYIVECPIIPGCLSQGETQEEALQNIKEAIDLCWEVRKEKRPTFDNYKIAGWALLLLNPTPIFL